MRFGLALIFILLSAPRAQPPGPSVAQLRAAFPGASLHEVSPSELDRLARAHASRGRMLTGPALRSLAVPAALAATPADTASKPPCAQADSGRRIACEDSLRAAARRDSLLSGSRGPVEDAREDTVVLGDGDQEDGEAHAADASTVEEARARGWFFQLFYDWHHGGDSPEWNAKDWAAVIYVVVGVIVVGAFIVYGVHALYELIVNPGKSPVFSEFGLRFSYSGADFSDGRGPALYRDAYLTGLRFAIGVDRGFLGLGLAAEAGYIDLHLTGGERPLEFAGGYLVAGPMLRFGRNRPLSFSLEFLNGGSDHRSIGWISKSRMALQGRAWENLLIGGHLGAVFYELSFLDGLAVRQGDFNRDLGLMLGADVSWAF